jgi:phosphoribosyl 1,2-cyclic phosphodiesterase
MTKFKVRFWGVRGSIATPGPATAEVGGNTSCVEVECGEERLVLDAGTGLRGLGDELVRRGDARVSLLLSHLHWDHIQGLPFFVPLYLPHTELDVYGPGWGDGGLAGALGRQMSAPGFPVELDDVPARLSLRELRHGSRFTVGDVAIRSARLNHPGGVLGYRIEFGGRSLVYATDTEHYDCVDPALAALSRGADVLIYDAQYTPEEYRGAAGPAKVGWGHSTFEAGIALARQAEVKTLVLFHHDPRRDDEALFALERRAQALDPRVVAAREGAVLELEDGALVAA